MAQLPMYPGIVNSPQTELSAAIDNVQNTVPVVDASKVPAAPNLATIGNDETAETILYTAKSGNTLTGVTRGFQGGAKAWGTGSKIARNFTTYDHDTSMGNIIDHETRLAIVEGAYPLTDMARQAIINGNFDVWQRGTTRTDSTDVSGYFLADRWLMQLVANGGTLPTVTQSRLSLTPGDVPGTFYGYRINVNGAGTALGTSSQAYIAQKIENGTRFLCGSGKKVTLSFWAKSDISGKKLGVNLFQDYGLGGSPSATETLVGTTFSLTSTWTKYSFTFTTNTLVGKTFGTNNDDSLHLRIQSMWGTSIGSRFNTASAETFVGAGNIDIIQVEVCAGEVALPFQPRSFAEELALCQRYFEKSYDTGTTPGNSTSNGAFSYSQGYTRGAGGTYFGEFSTPFKIPKRVVPTVNIYSTFGTVNAFYDGSTGLTVTGGVISTLAGQNGFQISSLTAISSAVSAGDGISYQWTADAEL